MQENSINFIKLRGLISRHDHISLCFAIVGASGASAFKLLCINKGFDQLIDDQLPLNRSCLSRWVLFVNMKNEWTKYYKHWKVV